MERSENFWNEYVLLNRFSRPAVAVKRHQLAGGGNGRMASIYLYFWKRRGLY